MYHRERGPLYRTIAFNLMGIALLALAQCAPFATLQAQEDREPSPIIQIGDIVPDEYIVMINPTDGVIAASLQDVHNLLIESGATILDDFSLIDGVSIHASPQSILQLQSSGRFIIEQNQVIGIHDSFEMADPDESTKAWGLDRIDQEEGLDGEYSVIGPDATDVTAYVIDTGLDEHPNLSNATQITNTLHDGIDTDCNGHGTHVAGIIGSTDFGVAKGVEIKAVKVLGCDGNGTLTSLLKGLDVVMNDSDLLPPDQKPILNMSLTVMNGSFAIDRATQALTDTMPVIVAAGNESGNACSNSPGRVPAAITVGSTDKNDHTAYSSNQGNCIDIFAPGDAIPSLWMNDSYHTTGGTSMATPHVTGVAALLMQNNPYLKPWQITTGIVASATKDTITGVKPETPNLFLNLGGIRPDIDQSTMSQTSAAITITQPLLEKTELLQLQAPTKNITNNNTINWSSGLDTSYDWSCIDTEGQAQCVALADEHGQIPQTITMTLTRALTNAVEVPLTLHWLTSTEISGTIDYQPYGAHPIINVGYNTLYLPAISGPTYDVVLDPPDEPGGPSAP